MQNLNVSSTIRIEMTGFFGDMERRHCKWGAFMHTNPNDYREILAQWKSGIDRAVVETTDGPVFVSVVG